MGDEEDLRSRIEAQVAARRAGSSPATRDEAPRSAALRGQVAAAHSAEVLASSSASTRLPDAPSAAPLAVAPAPSAAPAEAPSVAPAETPSDAASMAPVVDITPARAARVSRMPNRPSPSPLAARPSGGAPPPAPADQRPAGNGRRAGDTTSAANGNGHYGGNGSGGPGPLSTWPAPATDAPTTGAPRTDPSQLEEELHVETTLRRAGERRIEELEGRLAELEQRLAPAAADSSPGPVLAAPDAPALTPPPAGPRHGTTEAGDAAPRHAALGAEPTDQVSDEAAGPSAPEPRKTHAHARKLIVRLAIIVVIAVVASLLMRTYVLASYYIPSASMEPTLHGCSGCNNDHVLVDKLSYRLHDVHRGDVIVFNRPPGAETSDKVLIKRVIGLPGDSLTDVDGVLHVNGLVLNEPYVNPACHGTQTFPAQVVVPAGEVFVMGDNRCDSQDSRFFGPITESSIIGRAVIIVWPLGRLHYL